MSQHYDTRDVFTPSSPATDKSFIERQSISSDLVDALKTIGKQIIVYGHSGTGKSSLLRNKLLQTYEDHVISRCTSDLSFQQLILNAFDEIGNFYVDSKTKSKSSTANLSLSKDYAFIKGQIGFEQSKNDSETQKRFVPPQLTPQKLASFFGDTNACWVIDDFHKIIESEKKYLAQWMKVFMDESSNYPDVKIIAIGAVNTAREVIALDPELNNRVAEIHVPFMSPEELKEIIERGASKLQIIFQEEVKNKIIKLSCGLPAITHQLCLNICYSQLIYQTSDRNITFDLNDLDHALYKYINSNSGHLRDRYEKAVLKDVDGSYIHNYILAAIISIPNNINNISVKDITQYMNEKSIPKSDSAIESLLNSLTLPDRGSVLSFEEDSNTWFFSDPFLKVYCMCVINSNQPLTEPHLGMPSPDQVNKAKELNKNIHMDQIRKAITDLTSNKTSSSDF